MNDYKKIEITDILDNPSGFDNTKIEITGIARGIESNAYSFEGQYNLYVGFLQQKGDVLAIWSRTPGYFKAAYRLAMLKTSNETGLPITIQGTLTKLSKEKTLIYSKNKLSYELEVEEIAFANYLTRDYQIRDNTND